MKKYIINYIQTNTTHDKKISKYSEIGKIRYDILKSNDHFVKNEWGDMILSF